MTFQAIEEIVEVLTRWVGPIVVAYSGGKDSSAVLKLAINALLRKPELAGRVTVIYCDTKVENPILDGFVKGTLRSLKAELGSLGLEIRIKILSPALHQRYFVRVIGRGYPPPTSFFRWCTKDLRIRPVQTFIREIGERPLVLVGTRRGESAQRDRIIKKAGGDLAQGPLIQKQMDGGTQTFLYLPMCKQRRNGQIGLGPFTLRTRRLLLRRVRKLEAVVGHSLITPAEERAIRALWKQDEVSPTYRAMEDKHVRRPEQRERTARAI
jgi:3'-phosphoadenosine 5'-phosphosulfate sulfotransferase (PAPS reductase)/FAD synthetase